jgi:hypothetical protein
VRIIRVRRILFAPDPLPPAQGVLNYQGNNTLALALWAQDSHGAKISDLRLEVRGRAESAIGEVANLPFDAWAQRLGAY